jgi:hypothetical protein
MTEPLRPGWLSRVLGGFAKPVKHDPSSPSESPTPLTRSRIASYLDSRGYRYLVDDDGDLTGTWDGSRFWFLLLGDDEEILQVRGRWHRSLPLERRGAAALAVNDWNRERIWPKVQRGLGRPRTRCDRRPARPARRVRARYGRADVQRVRRDPAARRLAAAGYAEQLSHRAAEPPRS